MYEWSAYITVTVMLLAGAAMVFAAHRVLRVRSASSADVTPHATAVQRAAARQQRLRGHIGFALLLHGTIIGVSLLYVSGCLHERPLGLPGGEGETIAQGRIATNLQKVKQAEEVRKEQQQAKQRITRESLLQMLREQDNQVQVDQRAQTATTLDDVGLPTGVGSGKTAAGSPYGTRIGGKLWLYRVKYKGDWNANSAALPALLKEVRVALGVEVASRQEVVTLDDLPDHAGIYMPTMLFMTGTGAIETTDAQRNNLREYLTHGGMLIMDTSGGSFEQHAINFTRQLLPEQSVRIIEFDHDIYRGTNMPYRLPRGCPVYRQHGSSEARGVVDSETGRVVVLISPGDLGSAWASVSYGQQRGAVELAYQMGTNIVAYGLLNTRDTRTTEEAPK